MRNGLVTFLYPSALYPSALLQVRDHTYREQHQWEVRIADHCNPNHVQAMGASCNRTRGRPGLSTLRLLKVYLRLKMWNSEPQLAYIFRISDLYPGPSHSQF